TGCWAISQNSPSLSAKQTLQKETPHERDSFGTTASQKRSAANTDSGSEPETFPAAIQPNRLISAPARNEIAAAGTNPKKRRTTASGPVKNSPARTSQPAACSCSARSAAPCLSIVSQIKSA